MNYAWAAAGTLSNLVSDAGGLIGYLGGNVYLSLNGNTGWFAHESLSLRSSLILLIAFFFAAVVTSASIGAHHAMKTLLAPEGIKHAGIVSFIFPMVVRSDGTVHADVVVKAACVAFYMILYAVVGVVIVIPVVACGLVMFAFNALYIIGSKIWEMVGTSDHQPFPVTTIPLIGTVFALLNLMYSSALTSKKRFSAGAPSQ